MANQNQTQMDRCIKDCGECAVICTRCSLHCLGMGGEHASQQHQAIMQDCAQICAMAVGFMARDSAHATHVCRECAEICDACAESCASMADGDEMMTRCAETCRRCAESCRQMSGAGAGR